MSRLNIFIPIDTTMIHSKSYILLKLFLFTIIVCHCPKVFAIGPSEWTGNDSPNMNNPANWVDGVPHNETAIFNGNGNNAPLANTNGGITFDDIEFTNNTQISVITNIEATGSYGVNVSPGIFATFDIYEHQYPTFDPAAVRVDTGPTGDGGGIVAYNLQGFGQLYAFSGSTGATTVNVMMTNGNNYFEINNSGTNTFDHLSSDSSNDEIVLKNGANLTIRTSEFNTIECPINGDGSVTIAGTGILSLNNTNIYTGDTRVNTGTLILNGIVNHDLYVATTGCLKGNGTIGGNLYSSGTIAPGNSIGFINVTNFIATSSNTYDSEVSSSGLSDQIIATQSAVIAGTLNVIPTDSSFRTSKTYNILHAGTGLTGTFSNIISTDFALMKLLYTSNDIFLTYLPLRVLDLNQNALAAASCFTTLTGSDPSTITSELLSLSIPEVQQSFSQMQPSQFSALSWSQFTNALLVRTAYYRHLNENVYETDCNAECAWRLWVDGTGQWQQQNAEKLQFGYHDTTGGISIGADTLYEGCQVGAALSYTHTKLDWTQSAGTGNINSYYGGIYSKWNDTYKYINLSFLGAYNHYQTKRHIHFGSIDRHAHASHNGWEGLASIEAGIYSNFCSITVIPFGRIDYVYLSQRGYQEHGADSLNLRVHSRLDQLFQTELGITLTDRYQWCCGTFIPRLQFSYINQSPITKHPYKANFLDSTCEFNVNGWNETRNLGGVNLGLNYLTCSETVDIGVYYDGQFGRDYWNQSGEIVLNINF